MLKAVAFDAFGTLVDIFDKRRPYMAVARASQQKPKVNALTVPIDLEHYAQQCETGWNPAWADDLIAELASIKPYPESIDVLTAVKAHGLKTAVASNLALPYGGPVIELLGVWLDVACFSFDVGAAKPDVAFYTALCQRLDCAPEEVLMVGNTWRSDYAGATAAGLNAAHLNRRGLASQEQQKVAIRDLRELSIHL